MANRYPFQQSRSQQHVGMVQPNVPGFSGKNMWPQQQQLADDEKQREYLKQQQKLKLMSASTHKQQPVSADKLIENLLEKEDTFRLKATAQAAPSAVVTAHQIPGQPSGGYCQTCPTYPTVSAAHSSNPALLTNTEIMPGYAKQSSQSCHESTNYKGFSSSTNLLSQTDINKTQSHLPAWLSPTSSSFPSLFRQVWASVGQDKGLVDTSKIFPILLTSGLPTDVLGYIWGLANQKIAGQLTEEELYVVLSLVALAQSGCTFNNVSILNLIPQPPVPSLNVQAVQGTEELNLHTTEPLDEFTDFQSAACETSDTTIENAPSLNNSLLSAESIPAPLQSSSSSVSTNTLSDTALTQKFPSVLVMSNSGRGIGSRLANHSLGTPRQTKARHHKHHHHHHHRIHPQANQNSTTSVEEEFSDFQQAKDLACDGTEIFPKCVLKASQSKTFLLKESAIRTEFKLEGAPQSCGLEEDNSIDEITEKPAVGDISVLVKPESNAAKELMSVEEDKYSALRVLSVSSDMERSSVSDDFGDFLSAELSPTEDLFTEMATRETSVKVKENMLPAIEDRFWQSPNTHSSQSVEFKVDDWGSFESVPSSSNASSKFVDKWVTDIKLSQVKSETNPHLKLPIFMSAEEGLDLTSKDFSWDQNFTDIGKEKESETWKMSVANASLTGNVHGSGSWTLDSRDETSQRTNGLSLLGKIYDGDGGQYSGKVDLFASGKEPPVENNSLVIKNEDDEFGDFIGPETWPTSGNYNKDTLFDNQSGPGIKDTMFDSQSVSSLELPPLALSRHGSLPSLDLKTSGHQPWDPSPQGVEHQIREWCRCVQSCLQLVQAAVAIFSSISSDEVAQEVMSACRGRDYLYNLLEVYGICQRVRYSSSQVAVDSKQLETLLTDVDGAWANLEQCYAKADITTDIEFVSNTTTDSQEHCACGICLTSIGSDLMEHDSNTCHLEYGGQMYHAACANLWVNCVDCSLPALALL